MKTRHIKTTDLYPHRLCIVHIGAETARRFSRFWYETEEIIRDSPISEAKVEKIPYSFLETVFYTLPLSMLLGVFLLIFNLLTFHPPFSTTNVLFSTFAMSTMICGIGGAAFYILGGSRPEQRPIVLLILTFGALLGTFVGMSFPVSPLISAVPLKLQQTALALLSSGLVGVIAGFALKLFLPPRERMTASPPHPPKGDTVFRERDNVTPIVVYNGNSEVVDVDFKGFYYSDPSDATRMVGLLLDFLLESFSECINRDYASVIVVSDASPEHVEVSMILLKALKKYPFKKSFILWGDAKDRGDEEKIVGLIKEYKIAPIVLNEASISRPNFELIFRELPAFLTEAYRNESQLQEGFFSFVHYYLPSPYDTTSVACLCSWEVSCSEGSLEDEALLRKTVSKAVSAVSLLDAAQSATSKNADVSVFELAREAKFALVAPIKNDTNRYLETAFRGEVVRVFGSNNIYFSLISHKLGEPSVWIFGTLTGIPLSFVRLSNSHQEEQIEEEKPMSPVIPGAEEVSPSEIDMPAERYTREEILRLLRASLCDVARIRDLRNYVCKHINEKVDVGDFGSHSYELAEAIFDILKQNLRYCDDPDISGDYVAPPHETLENGMGDCDCLTLALGACLQAFGFRVRYLAFPGHANLMVYTRRGWVVGDLAMSEKLGEVNPRLKGQRYSVLLDTSEVDLCE